MTHEHCRFQGRWPAQCADRHGPEVQTAELQRSRHPDTVQFCTTENKSLHDAFDPLFVRPAWSIRHLGCPCFQFRVGSVVLSSHTNLGTRARQPPVLQSSIRWDVQQALHVCTYPSNANRTDVRLRGILSACFIWVLQTVCWSCTAWLHLHSNEREKHFSIAFTIYWHVVYLSVQQKLLS